MVGDRTSVTEYQVDIRSTDERSWRAVEPSVQNEQSQTHYRLPLGQLNVASTYLVRVRALDASRSAIATSPSASFSVLCQGDHSYGVWKSLIWINFSTICSWKRPSGTCFRSSGPCLVGGQPGKRWLPNLLLRHRPTKWQNNQPESARRRAQRWYQRSCSRRLESSGISKTSVINLQSPISRSVELTQLVLEPHLVTPSSLLLLNNVSF